MLKKVFHEKRRLPVLGAKMRMNKNTFFVINMQKSVDIVLNWRIIIKMIF